MSNKNDVSNMIGKKEAIQELTLISGYCAFKLSRKVLGIFLVILSVTLILCTDDSLPSFYLLAADLFLPIVLEYLLRSINHAPVFTMISKKYHYTYSNAKSASISFMCICLLLYLWQKRIQDQLFLIPFLNVAPTVLLFVFLLIRFVGQFYYRHKLHKMLLYCAF